LLNVNLTGGEPFARKDITDIARSYIKNTTVQSIYVTTNGSLPNRIENFAKEVTNFKNDIELTVQISIDDFPEKHNKVRKINNLFENCIDTYIRLKKSPSNVSPVVSITVNHENCDDIKNIYDYLVNTCKVDSLKCTVIRDEGVYKTPIDKKLKIFEAYSWLTKKILEMIKNKKIKNYNSGSIQAKLHNKKDEISWELIKKMYLKPHYISPCYAGGLFGIITASGSIYPCEILEYKLLGNLRENNMDFMKIWNSKETRDAKNFIKKTNCNCTYECALSYNILGNWRYQPRLISSIFNSY